MSRHKLTDRHVKSAKPLEKPYRLSDGDNLFLHVSPSGVRSWQFRYKFDGKPQTATLGKFPTISLADARGAAERARERAQEGKHLTVLKRVTKFKAAVDASNTFASVAADWIHRETRRVRWSPDYVEEVKASIKNHLSSLDRMPLMEISAPVAAPVLRSVERRAPHMLEKVRRRLRAILDFGVEQGLIYGNPLPTVRRSASVERRHFAAIVDLPGVGEILRNARAADPCKGIQRAHLLLAFTAMRVSEVVGAKWEEFSLDGVPVPIGAGHATKLNPSVGNWTIPRERMKQHKDTTRGPHVVPLPPALLSALREWKKADGDDAIYVCPAPRDPTMPVTPEGVEKFYRSALGLGGKHSPHSWRSAFSTIAREAGKEGDVVEAQLDHVVGTKVASAYDRAKRLELRRELMKWYEQQLVAARDGAEVIAMPKRK